MAASILTDVQTPQLNSQNDVNSILTPTYTWNEQFRSEKERLNTFENWPLEWLDKNTLAATGMFYTGMNDNTKCYFCEIVIGKWEPRDDPVQEHIRWSQNCPLLQRRRTDNLPLNEENLDLILPPAKDITYDTPPNWKTTTVYDYSIKSVRLLSFADWPRSMKQNPDELAEAGFYYKGCGDSVVCFSCLAGLKDWEEDDDPWEQHALWMGHICPYVKLVKSKEYIQSVYKKFRNKPVKQVEEKKQENQVTMISSDLDDSKLCKICYEKEYNTAYVPCGHVVSCPECALSVRECPVCRSTINKVVRLYFS